MKYRLDETQHEMSEKLAALGKDDHVHNSSHEDYLMYPVSGIRLFFFNEGHFYSSNLLEKDAVRHPKS